MSRRRTHSSNLIRIWLQKHEAGGLDEEAVDMVQEYEARIAALELSSASRPWRSSF